MTDTTTDTTAEAVETTEVVAERPEYLPEKFWNTEEGSPNVEGLAKSYTEIESKFGQRASALREEIESEIKKPREGVPESAEGYTYELSKEGLPEGWEIQSIDDDPMLGWWRDTAFDRGMTQDEFQAGINKYMEMQVAGIPDKSAEMKSLGENAQERIDRVDLYLGKNLTEDEYNTLADFAITAEAVQVLEKLIGIQAEPSISTFGGEPSTGSSSEDEIRAMMDDPRYWKHGEMDDAYRTKVTEMWQKLYG